MGDEYAILFRPYFLNAFTIEFPTFLEVYSESHKANKAGPQPENPQPIAPVSISNFLTMW